MANPEHVEIVKQGVAAVAAWRNSNPFARLDLIRVNLSDLDLSEITERCRSQAFDLRLNESLSHKFHGGTSAWSDVDQCKSSLR